MAALFEVVTETVAELAGTGFELSGASESFSAGRSVFCEIYNNTDEALERTGYSTSHGSFGSYGGGGDWFDRDPPQTIEAHGHDFFIASSTGLWTGTEGRITYKVAGTDGPDVLTIHFDNPFAGANSYDDTAAGAGYKLNRDGDGKGDNTEFSLVLTKA